MSEIIKKLRSDLITDPAQPMRLELEKDALWELAESIKVQGLINPITVRAVGDKYEVVAGHRRFKACQIAGVVEISCVIRELSDAQVFEIMAAENIERKDVDAVEESIFISRMINDLNLSADEVAQKLNRSRLWVNDRLAILDYPDYMLSVIRSGELKLGVAKHLGTIADDLYRKQFVDSAVKNGMSVSQAKFLEAQWEMGILRPGIEIMPLPDTPENQEKLKARAVCAACGTLAVEPNLRNVFIHHECPQPPKENE